jgi:ATP-dependent helicase/nuclease subunit A
MSRRPIPRATQDAQARASDPELSAWVSAHAGSGKTHVLTQRVVRLLLEGVPPSRILCLTYTKAAAANMAARIHAMLAKWALLDDAALDAAVTAVAGPRLDAATRDFARKLFARAVETPGGLKIQTIHAFCERLLHRFPFEANAPAGFRVLDEIERAELLSRARRETLARAMRDGGALLEAARSVARETNATDFDGLIEELLRARALLADAASEAGAKALRRRLSLEAHETLASIEVEMLEGGLPIASWPEIARRLRQGSVNDGKLAHQLNKAAALAPDAAALEDYLLVFLTKELSPRGSDKTKIITKGLCEADPALLELMEAERDRLAALLDKRNAGRALERSLALTRLGREIVAAYETLKSSRSLLDFDDLIAHARDLLRRSNPSWILYKLDHQIGHILLDEAQDTSGEQWEILAALAEEFAQEQKPSRRRTLFAVGDEKQSIYSFQGAAPEKFESMRRVFENRFKAAGLRFERVPLTLSFRSSPAILGTVDAIFASAENRRGLSFDPAEPPPEHIAWKNDAPGLVEIWEPIGPEKKETPADWRLPLDYVSEDDPAALCARKVAQKAKSLLNETEGGWVEGEVGPRPIEPGDILILVRKRDVFFESVIRALKEEHIPVAGADRLDLASHIAVMDLCALGRAALLPQDDLTLATLLKSPLVGLDDEDLIALAPSRDGALIDALRQSPEPAHQQAARQIDEWGQAAARLSPFDFYARALGAAGGRKRLVSRLGLEANDAIDEFLRLALAFEREEASGLVGFLAKIATLDISIKRDMEAAGGAVRVMTVHAAKGLEAKIVFLPDCCGAPSGRFDPKVFALDDDMAAAPSLLWSPKSKADPPAAARAREKQRAAGQEEHRRLLYVALTRAEERLYVAGFHGERGMADGCWHAMIRSALADRLEELPDPLNAERRILRSRDPPAARPRDAARAQPEPIALPAFALTPAPPERAPEPPLRPSSALAGADEALSFSADTATRSEAEALLLGRLTHAMLQHLPQLAREGRLEAALRFLALRAPGIDEPRREAAARAALRLLDAPSLAPLFGPESIAEVDIVARIETPQGVREIVGRIDRFAVTESEIVIADFKTGRPRANPLPSELRQLALYRAAAARLYPGKPARCVLIFTRDASVVEPAASALDAALGETEAV